MRRTTKILFFLFLILLLLGGFFYGENFCQAVENNIIINEIQISGGSKKTTWDYIELYNKSSVAIDISDWQLKKRVTKSDKIGFSEDSVRVFKANAVIPAQGHYLWVAKDAGLNADEISTSSIASDNSLVLLDRDKKIIDQVAWGNGHIDPFIETSAVDVSEFIDDMPEIIERQNFQDTGNNNADFKIIATGSPTPSDCLKNPEKCSLEDDSQTNLSDKLIITELLPDPAAGSDEYIELYNSGDTNLNLKNWSLHDASLSGEFVFSADYSIVAKKYLVIYKVTYAFALNNSDDENVTLFDPHKKEISKVSYNGSKENISYNFNSASTAWHWSKFLTPGEENIFNNEPYGTVKIDADVFVNVFADFSVSTGDADGEKVKVTWEFGDGHRSYKEKTTHKYDAEGTYAGTVKLSDGSEDIIKNFTVEVEKYPTPKIKIVKIKANPKGKDILGEEIYLKNNSKKKINLKTWSLATGDKNLYNHPITKDFIIQPGKTKKITRKYSLFTLNNKKGIIELRYPNGEVASRVKYDKKKETIKDDEVYELSGKNWQWDAPLEESAESETAPIPEETTENIEPATEPEISEEEISLNLGKYSTENKLALAEIGFAPISKNLLQSRETQSIVLGAFSTRDENHKPVEIKSVNYWQKTLQKSNQLFNFLINRFIRLI